MYTKLVLAVLVLWGGLLQAQVVDSLPVKDSLYAKTDTVYIEQPPLIIKRQVVVHDTVAELSNDNLKTQKFKEALSTNWYVDATVGLDHWLGKDEIVDTTHFHKRMGYSAAVSIGKEIGSFLISVGVGTQQMIIHEQIEKTLIRYDSALAKKPKKDRDGHDICWQELNPETNKEEENCLYITYTKHDTIVSKYKVITAKNHFDYITIPIKLGKSFYFEVWYLRPEVWIVPMFILESSTFMESSKLKFNHKQTAYRIVLNAGIPINKKLHLELGTSYQGSLGHSLIDMQFVNLHFGLKYYISKGTN